jgi:hypothetical protein
VAGQTPVKRNRFVQLSGGTKSINRQLEAKARTLAGLKGYITNLDAPTAEYVMGAYHQLWQIEKSFRMSKSDLRARPIYHHKRDSIEAHLTIVFAALAVSRWLEQQTGWSIKKLITALRRYHTIDIKAGDQIVTAADPSPTTSGSSSTGSTAARNALIDQSRAEGTLETLMIDGSEETTASLTSRRRANSMREVLSGPSPRIQARTAQTPVDRSRSP